MWQCKLFESKYATSNMYKDFSRFGLIMCIGERMLGDAQGQHKAADHMEQPLPPGFFQALGLDEIQEQAEMNFGMRSILASDTGSLRCGTVADNTPSLGLWWCVQEHQKKRINKNPNTKRMHQLKFAWG